MGVTSADDSLTSTGAQAPRVGFVASQAEIPRTKRVKFSNRETSTELGREEMYAKEVPSPSATGASSRSPCQRGGGEYLAATSTGIPRWGGQYTELSSLGRTKRKE